MRRSSPPLAARGPDSKYKEFFICWPALPGALFRLVGPQANFRENHVTDSAGALTDAQGKNFDESLSAGRALLGNDPEAALAQAKGLLRFGLEPRALALAAAALRELGEAEQAEQAELTAIKASFAIQELDDAAVASHDGRKAEARVMIERYLAREPDSLLALTMAADEDINAWALEQAEGRLRAVLTRAPHFLRALMLLAKCLKLQARLREAMDVIDGIIERKPNNPPALTYLAQLSAEANDHEKAAEAYGKLVELDSRQTDMWTIYAQELRMLGRKDESQAAFRKALELDPCSGAAWWGLVYYFTPDISEDDVGAIQTALAAQHDAPDESGPLQIALGLLADRRGDHAEAFRLIAAGKHLRSFARPFDSAAMRMNVDQITGSLTRTHFAALAGSGYEDNSPIFIIGMPRSGTTLLERILSGHSQVQAGGELPIMPRLYERLRRETEATYPERVAALGEDELTKLGKWYVERSLDYRTSDKARFIDKLNSNWFHTGLIRLMLPNARIIDLRRNALDCCWSNFKMLFAEGDVASNDQRDIARYYRDYVRMVDSIDAASPGGITHVRYEDLVDDVEGQTRRILDFLGLEYEPQCIDFHLSTAAVATPSSEQVRRPINREGIGSAEPYRQWLGPMIEELASQSL